jgi:hypothetical protein
VRLEPGFDADGNLKEISVVSDFLDYRTAPKPEGGVIGAVDLSHLTPGQKYGGLFIYGYVPGEGPKSGALTVTRLDDGSLEASTNVEGYEPVLEGEVLVGLRFPGSDRYPFQAWDQERDGQ